MSQQPHLSPAEQRLRVAQEALEELLLKLPLPYEYTQTETILWATLLRAIPIERTCLTCSQEFLIALPNECECPNCSGEPGFHRAVEKNRNDKSLAQLIIGIQAGLLLARESLGQLQQQAPAIAQLLEDTLRERQVLRILALSSETTPREPAGVLGMIEQLCQVANAWVGYAEQPD